MVRDVLGSLLLLGGALWLWLGLVQAQRRQLRLLEELAASLEQMASAIRFRRETLLRLLAAQRQRPLAGPYYGAVLAALEEDESQKAIIAQEYVNQLLAEKGSKSEVTYDECLDDVDWDAFYPEYTVQVSEMSEEFEASANTEG